MNIFNVKLVEPSLGRIVELQITEQRDFLARLYMEQLTDYAKSCERNGAQWKVTGKTVRITFPNDHVAEAARQAWRK